MRFELRLIIGLINNDYSLLETEQFKRIDLRRFFKICSVNRLLYKVCLTLRQSNSPMITEEKRAYIQKILQEGEPRIQAYRDTLIRLKEIFEKHSIEWLLIKTDKGIPYVVNDIDILVRQADFEPAKDLIRSAASKPRPSGRGQQTPLSVSILSPSTGSGRMVSLSNQSKPLALARGMSNGLIEGAVLTKRSNQIHITMKDLCKIDIHSSFYQLETLYIDTGDLWKGVMEKEFQGVRYKTPSMINEASMIILNTLYGCFYIPLLDCFYFKNNLSSINFAEIYAQAKRQEWNKGLQIYSSILYNIFNVLFIKDGWETRIPNKIPVYCNKSFGQLRMPYIFTPLEMFGIFKERGQRINGQDFLMFAYYFYAKFRYLLTGGTRVPIHAHWFKF